MKQLLSNLWNGPAISFAVASCLLTSCAVNFGPDGKPELTLDHEAIGNYAADQVHRGFEHLIEVAK